jgi:hypothetical protein
MRSGARISRVHSSWRVRVPGLRPHFFADRKHGGTDAALSAAKGWRDTHWDGEDRSRKLTKMERLTIRHSKEHYKIVAERFRISPNYVHKIRRGRSRE